MKPPIKKPPGALQEKDSTGEIGKTDGFISLTTEKTIRRRYEIRVPRQIRDWFRKVRRQP
jgi:hypothetical protein